ncbi:MAG: hypothetical protein ACLGPM_02945, partial [Acidobacteriota bacterium]
LECAAESLALRETSRLIPSKAALILWTLSARVNSCPFKTILIPHSFYGAFALRRPRRSAQEMRLFFTIV